ncbi:ketoacyl-synthetase C-terminal extension domain-containing protein, partial [Streptomyces sp. BE303]|uniref:ketoacyl-synthetase C-terminal extension domain-containing protein n=1 Tax=Streptomyces sp. BE303 TaxID=3002528 RepID=UPI002E7611E8
MGLALRPESLPATLHAEEPSTEVNWSAGAVELLTESRRWSAGDRPRRAGVSAFGVIGTNAHVIVEEPPTVEAAAVAAVDLPLAPVLLSGTDEAALRAQAQQLRLVADRYLNTLASAAARRAALSHLAVVL